MRALLKADRSAQGRNVVDLRGVLVDRLEERLDRLEDTHREVLAAAYENVAGMNQVHRACLALLEPGDFAGFLQVADPRRGADPRRRGDPARDRGARGRARRRHRAGGAVPAVVVALPEGGVSDYVTQGRGLGARRVTLRQLLSASPDFYGAEAAEISSEALIRLDLGEGNLPRPAALRRQRSAPVPPRPGHRSPGLLRRRLRAQPAALAGMSRRPHRPRRRRG